ncbi:MAG: ribonuclease J [Acidobacteria bacterium]|nr:ribonuclease J [Acidobacteriota bacterium]
MNMMAIRYGDAAIVIDAGLMFPEDSFHGVDFIVPDMTYLLDEPAIVKAVFLSHGHEDHIGALPHLFQRVKCPVYGTKLTLGFARQRLEEYRIDTHANELNPVRPGETVEAGPFRVEFLQVTHSIPDAVAMAIRTPVGTIVHTADFKIDQTPVDGRLFDFRRFTELGSEGVLALLSDSTNAARPGFTPSEREVGRALEPLVKAAKGRVIVTTFASNIHRLQQIVAIAARTGRKVAFLGRSVASNVRVSEELGYMHVPPGIVIDPRELERHPPGELVAIVSGSQGEPMSALSRLALNDHRDLTIGRGDLVILSARRIPGNERPIGRVVNHLCRRGADVLLDDGPARIHVSGHASREELKIMLSLTRPKYFIPVHGDFQHLSQHARIATEMGWPDERVLLAETGDIIELDEGSARVTGKARVGSVFIDGTLEEVEEMVIRDRRHIAEDGVVVPIVLIDQHTGNVESEPEIVSRGFVWVQDEKQLFSEAAAVVMESIRGCSVEERGDNGFITMRIQADLKRFLRKRTQRRPMIIPVVLEV